MIDMTLGGALVAGAVLYGLYKLFGGDDDSSSSSSNTNSSTSSKSSSSSSTNENKYNFHCYSCKKYVYGISKSQAYSKRITCPNCKIDNDFDISWECGNCGNRNGLREKCSCGRTE